MPTGRRAGYGLERLLDVLPVASCPWRLRHGRVHDAVLCLPVRHDQREPGTLRRQVRSSLDLPEVPEEAADDALVVVSELVTNAVTHGTSPAELPIVAALASDHGLTVRPGAGACWAALPLDRPRRDGEGGDQAACVALTTAFAALLLVAVFTAGCLLQFV
ncbi:hypothetical protein PV350_08500 [Streptomyces sp. PA03-6a]|nr:hypothetical protein [Streptomyces sp. PA03-6a]